MEIPRPAELLVNLFRRLCKHFGRAHLYVFLGLYLAFSALTALALSMQSESDRRENWNLVATLGAVSGPFTGTIARHFQDYCAKFSMRIFPYSAGFLAAGTILQIVPIPFRTRERSIRLLAWSLGLLGWFGGAIISFGHALS